MGKAGRQRLTQAHINRSVSAAVIPGGMESIELGEARRPCLGCYFGAALLCDGYICGPASLKIAAEGRPAQVGPEVSRPQVAGPTDFLAVAWLLFRDDLRRSRAHTIRKCSGRRVA